MPLMGEYGAWSGPMKPSSEWRFHLDIMRARPDVGAIVHFHPPYGCALAMLHKPILAAHYMIALFGGPVVKCVKYAPYGTKELSDLVVEGLGERNAVLLGNHGALVAARDLNHAMYLAPRAREPRAHTYYLAISAGRPAILSDDEVMRTVERFKSYGSGRRSAQDCGGAEKANGSQEEIDRAQEEGDGVARALSGAGVLLAQPRLSRWTGRSALAIVPARQGAPTNSLRYGRIR